MIARKNCSLFVALAALLSVTLSGPAFAVVTIKVDDLECPNGLGAQIYPLCMAHTVKWVCERTNSSPVQTDGGDWAAKEGEGMAGRLNCSNCVTGCSTPEVMPAPAACTKTLKVSFTEQVSATVASGISAGVAGIKSSLEASIGHVNARTYEGEALCGTHSLPGCQKQSFGITMEYRKNVKTKMDHTYRWKGTAVTCNWFACDQKTLHTGNFFPQIYTEWAGTRTSTAIGTSYYAWANCFTISASLCP